MAKARSTYPSTIDETLQTDRKPNDTITSTSYDVIEDAIFKLETKVGVTNSSDHGSMDYKQSLNVLRDGSRSMTGALTGTSAYFSGTVSCTTFSGETFSGTNVKATTLTATTLSGINLWAETITATTFSGTNVRAATMTAVNLTATGTISTTTIVATGSIGIGTSPQNYLHLYGTSPIIKLQDSIDGVLGFIGSADELVTGTAGYLAVRAESGLYFSGGGNAKHVYILPTGNVGIGGIPTTKFHVQNTTSTGVRVTASNTDAYAVSEVYASTAQAWLSSYGSSFGGTLAGLSCNNMVSLEANYPSAFVISTVNTDSAPIVFAPGRVEAMRIAPTGNIGVGTTPSQLLHIHKLNSALQRWSSSTNVLVDFGFVDSGTAHYPYVTLGTACTHQLFIDNGVDKAARGIAVRNSGGSFNAVHMYNDDTKGCIESSNALAINLGGQNVGVGMIPVQKLDISGGSVAIDNNYYYRVRDTGGVARTVIGLNNSNHCFVGPSGAVGGNTYIQAYGGAGITLFGTTLAVGISGNVGVGFGPLTWAAFTIDKVVTAAAGVGAGMYIQPTVTATAHGDILAGAYFASSIIAKGAFDNLTWYSYYVGNSVETGTGHVANKYGLYLGYIQYGTNNYQLAFEDDDLDVTTFTTGLQSGDIHYTLPTSISAGSTLQVDANGVMSWNTTPIIQLGSDISALPPRPTIVTMTVSTVNNNNDYSVGIESIIETSAEAAYTDQRITGVSAYVSNYGVYGVADAGAGVGLWASVWGRNTGQCWGAAVECFDDPAIVTSDCILGGLEVLVGRLTASTKASYGINVVAGGDGSTNSFIDYGLWLTEYTGGTGNKGFKKGIYAEQSALGTGATDSFIELLNYFRVKTDGSVKIGGNLTRATSDGIGCIDLINGTAPVGALTDGSINGLTLYSALGHLRYVDHAGINGTVLAANAIDSTAVTVNRRLKVDIDGVTYYIPAQV